MGAGVLRKGAAIRTSCSTEHLAELVGHGVQIIFSSRPLKGITLHSANPTSNEMG